jgi:CRP/FNR family transcriptional regulator, cyclic AMP receptor protein
MTTPHGEEDGTSTTAAFAAFSPAVEHAWRQSFLAALPPVIVRSLLGQARESSVSAGEIFYRGAYHPEMAMLALVADGLLRIYLQTDTGRQVTMQYHQPGAVVGSPALLLGGARADGEPSRQSWHLLGGSRVYGEALRDTLLLRLSPPQFLELARTEVSVAWAVASYLGQRAMASQQMLSDDLFLSVRARVARHLIEMASTRDDALVVRANHQAIADAIGSVREVVSRALSNMREEGLITRRGGETVLLDVERLRVIAALP